MKKYMKYRNVMKGFVAAVAVTLLGAPQNAAAQDDVRTVDGASYYLPKTELRFSLLVEKATFTPGDLAPYASRYLRRDDVSMEPSTQYRIVGMQLSQKAVPDTTKFFTAKIDGKHSVRTLSRDENGVLLAVNAEPREAKVRKPFVAAPKPAPVNPRDYMTQEILSAANKVKMAELCVQEIYDIRENKSLLNKGQADFMPKDGEQLRLMINNLNAQENALLQLFEGTTDRDTTEVEVAFVPTREVEKQLLFRFSKYFGLTDADDLSGKPYYIKVEDLHSSPTLNGSLADPKKDKDNIGICVNLPGKIRATVFSADRALGAFELYAPQFGTTESLSGEMFSKKFTSHLVLNPVTGSIESLETEPLK